MAALLLVSACAPPAEKPTAADSATTATAEASATSQPSETTTPSEAPARAEGRVPVKDGLISDGRGEYQQTTIADDDPAMIFTPTIADETATSRFSTEELASAQAFTIRFLAEEGLDSTANGGGGPEFEAWWTNTGAAYFHPVQRDVIYTDASEAARTGSTTEGSPILRAPWRAGKYDFDYSAGTRITERSITPTHIEGTDSPSGQPYVGIQSTVSLKSPIVVDGRKTLEQIDGNVTYRVMKDESDGNKWKIVGYQADYNGYEAARQ